jgi:hypothetical protein
VGDVQVVRGIMRTFVLVDMESLCVLMGLRSIWMLMILLVGFFPTMLIVMVFRCILNVSMRILIISMSMMALFKHPLDSNGLPMALITIGIILLSKASVMATSLHLLLAGTAPSAMVVMVPLLVFPYLIMTVISIFFSNL